jgi:ABC-type lipoprotein release transport system permease subunit
MSLWRLIRREIVHHRLNFLTSAASVVVAIALVALVVARLRAHDRQTATVVAEMQASAEAEMAALEDSIRKSMKGLGFNIYVFPEGQDMSEVYAQGFASKTMPESYVNRLAESKLLTVNHLLPTLTRKVTWPEQKRTVVLIGIRGEVPLAHRDPKKPLLQPVTRGHAVLGYELHHALGLKPGDTMTLMGQTFTIDKCHHERGSVDDITIWLNLGQCQEMLDLAGRINAIQALECNCATIDRLGEVRAELGAILPGTKIIEKQSQALARAEARNTARATAKARIEAVTAQRAQISRGREATAAVILPLLALLCIVWIAVLAFLNARDRTSEIGILRAIGISGGAIHAALLARAAVVGVVGAGIGLIVVLAAGSVIASRWLEGHSPQSLFAVSEAVAVLLLMPVLACIAAWLPSLHAARQDPATVLRHD